MQRVTSTARGQEAGVVETEADEVCVEFVPRIAASYTHPDQQVAMRPDIGTQDKFRKKKAPATYRYDSSLSPALDWDGQHGARELGEWLLARISEAAALPAPHRFSGSQQFTGANGAVLATVHSHVLFPKIATIVQHYFDTKVIPVAPAEKVDAYLSPYYGWAIERISAAITPDTGAGEAPEVPVFESSRGPGSTADVDYWTSKDVREVLKCHLNYVVADTKVREQSAAYVLDTHPKVDAFVKNAGLGFAIPYLHNGQPHDYLPDFIIRLVSSAPAYLVLETKGFDELAEVKAAAAQRWVAAVNAEGQHGVWRYEMARSVGAVTTILDAV